MRLLVLSRLCSVRLNLKSNGGFVRPLRFDYSIRMAPFDKVLHVFVSNVTTYESLFCVLDFFLTGKELCHAVK